MEISRVEMNSYDCWDLHIVSKYGFLMQLVVMGWGACTITGRLLNVECLHHNELSEVKKILMKLTLKWSKWHYQPLSEDEWFCCIEERWMDSQILSSQQDKQFTSNSMASTLNSASMLLPEQFQEFLLVMYETSEYGIYIFWRIC